MQQLRRPTGETYCHRQTAPHLNWRTVTQAILLGDLMVAEVWFTFDFRLGQLNIIDPAFSRGHAWGPVTATTCNSR